MAKALLIGCGQLGTAIALALHRQGVEVIGVRKSAQPLPLGMQTIQANVLFPSTLKPLSHIDADYVIYCMSAPARTDESYAAYYVQGLQHIINSQQANARLKRMFFISSTRVYGQEGDALLNEHTKPLPKDFGGKRLLEAEQLLAQCSYDTTVLRLSGIYSEKRLYLIRMAKAFDQWPKTNGWSNRIHESDAAGFIAHLLMLAQAKALESLYIVTDSQPAKQYEVLMWLTREMRIEVNVAQIPNEIKGKKLSNQRLLATDYVLQYPDYQTGYTAILKAIH